MFMSTGYSPSLQLMSMGNASSETASSLSDDDDEDEENRTTADTKETTTAKQSEDEENDEEDDDNDGEHKGRSPWRGRSKAEVESDCYGIFWCPPDISDLYRAKDLNFLVKHVPNNANRNHTAVQVSGLLRYLDSRYARCEMSVGKYQFCETLVNWGMTKEDSEQCFALFDTEGRQELDVPSSINCVRAGSLDFTLLKSGLPCSLQVLQRCGLMPGIADIRVDTVDWATFQASIGNFLNRVRLSADILPYIPHTSLDAIFRLRKFIIDSWIHDERFTGYLISMCSAKGTGVKHLHEPATKSTWPTPSTCLKPTQEDEIGCGVPPGAEILRQCYISVDVSSNKKDVGKLTDGDATTFWQSDGRAGGHYIDVTLRRNVVVTKLSLNVSPLDRNFMPNVVALSVARNDCGELRPFGFPIREIPPNFRGRFYLIANGRHRCRRIRIAITRCHGNGADTRIRGIEIEGYQNFDDEEKPKTSQWEEAGAMWYLNILTSTVEACLPIAPTLKRMVVDHAKTFSDQLFPLCLAECDDPDSPTAKKSVLTPAILDAAERSLGPLLIDSGDDITAAALKVLSSFALARLNPTSVILLVHHLLNSKSTLQAEAAADLRRSMESTMTGIFTRYATRLSYAIFSINGTAPVGFGDRVSLETPCASPQGEQKLDILLKCAQGRPAMLVTRVVIQISPTAPEAPTAGVIYAISNEAAAGKFLKSSHVGSYSDLNIKEIGRLGECKSKTEVEIFLEPCSCQFILLRFTEPREPGRARGLATEKIVLYGFTKPRSTVFETDDMKYEYLPALWKDVDESNPNAELARRLLLFADIIYELAFDFGAGSLDCGLSECITPIDLDQLEICFASIFRVRTTNWPLAHTFLQFVANLFRKSEALKFKDGSLKLRELYYRLVMVSSSKDKSDQAAAVLSSLAVDIIANGIQILYTTRSERKNALLDFLPDLFAVDCQLVTEINFTALSKCFSGFDASPLFDVPYDFPEMPGWIKEHIVDIFDLLYTGYARSIMSELKKSQQAPFDGAASVKKSMSSVLAEVLNAQQLQFFMWYWYQKKKAESIKTVGNDKEHRLDDLALELLSLSLRHLTKLFSEMLAEFSDVVLKDLLINPTISFTDCTNIGSAFNSIYQLAISTMKNSSSANIQDLLKIWSSLMLDKRLRDIITTALSETAKEKLEELSTYEADMPILHRWKVESSHPYDCPSHTQKIFRQPGAVVFEIEFDSGCNIADNDCLIFVSDRERTVTIRNPVSEKRNWPKRVSIRSRDQLLFFFHSEIRTSVAKYFGYKFTIVARGPPKPALAKWAPDLFFTLIQFGGHLLSVRLEVVGQMNNREDLQNVGSDNIGTSSADAEILETSERKTPVGQTLAFGKGFLKHFRNVDESQKTGASLATLTFLRSSMDVIAGLTNSVYSKDIPDATILSNALISYWLEVVECKDKLASNEDGHLWLLNILHLFPWCCLEQPYIYDQSNAADVDRIIKVLFEAAIRQLKSLKRRPIQFQEEPIDIQLYGTFRDWLAMLRSGSTLGSVSEGQFLIWRQLELNSSVDMDGKRKAKLFVSQYSDVLKRRFICDGCDRTVDGRRYHCMDCVDTDLCASCLAFGDGPIYHSNNHRLVAFNFKCNNCGGYIIGSRFHCSVCKDFDICFGCMLNRAGEDEETESEHRREHAYVTFPPMYIREDDAERQLMDQYVNQTAWLFLTRLALRLFSDRRLQCSASNDPQSGALIPADVFSAALIETATNYFLSKSTPSDQSVLDSNDSWIWNNRAASAERDLSERLLGLICLVADLYGNAWTHLRDAIVLICRLLKSEDGERRSDDHLVFYALRKLCLAAGPEVSDRAMNECSRAPVAGCEPGYLMLQFLFVFGSSCLTTMKLQWSATVAWIWNKFLEDAGWSTVAGNYLRMKMVADESVDHIETVYACLIFTGFPGFFARGAEVEYVDGEGQRQRGVVVEMVGERGLCKIMAPGSRRFYFVRVKDIVQFTPTSSGRISRVIDLADLIVDAQIAVTNVWDEGVWSKVDYDLLLTAALSMKAVSIDLAKEQDLSKRAEELFASFFCQDLLQIASQPTTLPLGTRTEMVENFVFALLDSSTSKGGTDLMNDDNDENDDREIGFEFLYGLQNALRKCMRGLHKEFNISFSLLRAIYDVKRGDATSLLYEVRRLFLARGRAAPLHQDIVFRAAYLERSVSAKSDYQRLKKYSIGPTDSGVSSFPLVSDRLADASRLEMSFVDEEFFLPSELAPAHTEWTLNGLAGEGDNEDKPNENYAAQMLFESNLRKEGQSRHDLLRRTSTALAVLYARKLLSQLIARWPETIPFDEDRFGLENYWQFLNVADALNLTPDCDSDAWSVIFDRCPKTVIKSLSYACCQLLQEGIDETVRRKFTGSIFGETIKIPKASCVRVNAAVTFGDGKITFRYVNDRRETQTVKPSERPVDDILNTNEIVVDFIPGRFGGKELAVKVIGKNFRYFETGYKMLRLVLNGMREDESIRSALSIDHVWVWLLYLCCRTTGGQRLKIIDLLIRLVSSLGRPPPNDAGLPIELRLAMPLWKLLGDLNLICANRRLNYMPETGRSLAQFFYILEGVALKWNAADTFSFSMCDSKPAIRSYAHGCRIVANVCAGIGMENDITTLLQTMAAVISKKNQAKDQNGKTADDEMTDGSNSDSDDGELPDLELALGEEKTSDGGHRPWRGLSSGTSDDESSDSSDNY